MAVTLNDLAKAMNLGKDKTVSDEHVYGEVKAINADRTYQVALNGSDTTTRCARLAGAKVGDTVLVTILKNGYAVVTSTVGGDTDAEDAQETADSILIYDHGYTVAGGVAYFTAYLYQGGKDIKESFDSSQFTWYRKTEDGTEYLGSGYTMSVALSSCGYGAEIIGHFTTTDDSEALTSRGDILTTDDDSAITVRASGESVRVRDLAASTVLYDTEKIMVVGTEDEHLITLDTLYGYLHDQLENEVIYCGSATELVG